jgi:molybdopterin molybdotransferase
MPEDCDCVIDSDAVDRTGPLLQAVAEATPGQGVRRAGGDIAEGTLVTASGRRLRPFDLMIARAAGLARLNVRRPTLRIVDIPAASGDVVTAQLVTESARALGATVAFAEASARDAASIASTLEPGGCDMLITIGGSGVGRTDATIAALAERGEVLAHGIALQPGTTSALAKIGKIPVVALPGAPDQALAVWWTLALPVLDRLSGRLPPTPVTLPLARKVASSVGIAEIVLLEKIDTAWMPLAVGDLSLATIARSHAWLLVPGGSEGFAAGTLVDAYILRD